LYCKKACQTKSFFLRMVNFHQHQCTGRPHTYRIAQGAAILILRVLTLSGTHCMQALHVFFLYTK
jgi:hypothetical protein